MKTILKVNILLMLTLIVGASTAFAQRVITGTVYDNGEPAAGVEVSAHKGSGSYFTSFDGKYELEASEKSKYIKFVFPDTELKLDIEGKTENIFDYFRGEKPAATTTGGVDMRSHSELATKDKDYQQVYTLYNQFMKNKDYKSALPHWEQIMKQYPKSSPNIYIKGIAMYDTFIKSASGAERDALIKREMEIYDQRAEMFGDKVGIEGKKAVKMLDLTVNDNMTDSEKTAAYKKAYPMLEEAVKASGNDASTVSMVKLMVTTRELFKIGEFGADKVISNYDLTNTIVDANLANDNTSEKYLQAQKVINLLFERSGAADCDALIALYQPKFEANPEDTELLTKMMTILSRNNCTESELFLQGAERSYQIKPTASSATAMAQRYVKLGDQNKALEYYKEAMSMDDADDDTKARISYGMAAIYMSQKNYPAARNSAKTAASLRDNFAAAYKLIGDVYKHAAGKFGSSDFDHQSVYMVAQDYYNKAARMSEDAQVAASARKQAASLKQYFPKSTELFFLGAEFAAGSQYKVGGWINEVTTIKASDK